MCVQRRSKGSTVQQRRINICLLWGWGYVSGWVVGTEVPTSRGVLSLSPVEGRVDSNAGAFVPGMSR